MIDFNKLEFGVLYKFDIDKYLRKEIGYRISNGGIKRQLVRTEIACVYEFNEDGKIERRTRGSFVKRDGSDEFIIVTSEDEEEIPFEVTVPFVMNYDKGIVDEIALYNEDPSSYIESNGNKK